MGVSLSGKFPVPTPFVAALVLGICVYTLGAISGTVLFVSSPAGATPGLFGVGRATGRSLDEDTQYGTRQFSARSGNQQHES